MIQNPFRTFKNSNYLFYWVFNTFSLIGTWVDFTLRQWVIVEMIKSERLASQYIGIYNLIRFIPSVFLSFFAGYLSDKVSVRLILLAISMVDFLNACFISYLVFTNNLNTINFLILALFLGITSSFYFPTRSKLINSIVKDKQDIPGSFSWQGISFNFSRIVGPIIAGYVAKYFGLSWGFALNALSFVPLMIYLLFSNEIRSKDINNLNDNKTDKTFIETLKNTLYYINSNRSIKKCFYSIFTVNFWGISLMSFLQVFTKEILGAGISYFSFLMSCLGLGAMVGAFIVASTNYQVILSFREEFFILVYGLLILILSFLPEFSFFIIFFIGVFQALTFGFTNNKVQLLTDGEVLGKVMGIYSMFNISLSYFGIFCISQIGYMLGILNLFKVVSLFIILSALFIGIRAKEGLL
ncbi:MAG: MFS transporter [bacterium]|nr:MFS transporter [bacterium]